MNDKGKEHNFIYIRYLPIGLLVGGVVGVISISLLDDLSILRRIESLTNEMVAIVVCAIVGIIALFFSVSLCETKGTCVFYKHHFEIILKNKNISIKYCDVEAIGRYNVIYLKNRKHLQFFPAPRIFFNDPMDKILSEIKRKII